MGGGLVVERFGFDEEEGEVKLAVNGFMFWDRRGVERSGEERGVVGLGRCLGERAKGFYWVIDMFFFDYFWTVCFWWGGGVVWGEYERQKGQDAMFHLRELDEDF